MKDKLKIFTEENRESFESYKLDLDDAWQGIEERLNTLEENSVKISWANILKIAAIFIVVMTFAFGFYLNNQRISRAENGIALHNISSELADTEAFYTSLISEKIELIEFSAGNIEPEIQHQINILDEEYLYLKADLNDNADSEEVIDAMIKNYRLKLAMLEKILEEIQDNDDYKNNEETLAI
jgi:hypothetical protein